MPVKPAFHPLYQQVKESLIRRIAIGEWAPGTFLPSEPALAEEYGVSHGTLRKALNELTAERRVVRYQGKGTAVATFDADEALFRFFRIVSCEDRRTLPISEVYSATPANADAEEAAALDIPVGAPVFRIERVRSLDGVPLLNESISLNCARMPGIEAIPHNARSGSTSPSPRRMKASPPWPPTGPTPSAWACPWGTRCWQSAAWPWTSRTTRLNCATPVA